MPEQDFEKAQILLDEFDRKDETSSGIDWSCKNCGQPVESQFDTCWNCGSSRKDTPSTPKSQVVVRPDDDNAIFAGPDVLQGNDESTVEPFGRSSLSLWIETLVVLALTLPIYGGHSTSYILVHLMAMQPTFLIVCFERILSNGMNASVVLAAIYWSREPWSTFAIKMPPNGLICFQVFCCTTPSSG